jgi:hypothetical protein
MDILAHGLWTGATYTAANKKNLASRQAGKKPLNVKWAVLWGVFPDFFAFTIPLVWFIWHLSAGDLTLQDLPRPRHDEPPALNHYWVNELARLLYNISHSLIIFAIVFGIVWFVYKKPRLELAAWLLHILIDVPTHTYEFYPTPVFWPVFGWKFSHGISWGQPWFMVLNYSCLVFVWFWLTRARRRARKISGWCY